MADETKGTPEDKKPEPTKSDREIAREAKEAQYKADKKTGRDSFEEAMKEEAAKGKAGKKGAGEVMDKFSSKKSGDGEKVGKYGKEPETKVKVTGDLKAAVKATETEKSINDSLSKNGQKVSKQRLKDTTHAGNVAHNAIDEAHTALLKRKDVAHDVYKDELKEIGKEFKDALKGAPSEEARKAAEKTYNAKVEGVNKAYNKTVKEIDRSIETLEKQRVKVTKNTGVESLFNAEKPKAKPGMLQSRAVIDESKGIIGKEAYEKLGSVGKGAAAIKANLKAGGMKTATTAVGLIAVPAFGLGAVNDIAVGAGLKDPGKDENGKPAPTEGKLVTGLFKGGVALGGLALALRGGANRAMGH